MIVLQQKVMQVVTAIIVIIDLKPSWHTFLLLPLVTLFVFYLTKLWDFLLCFPIKNVEKDLPTQECRLTWASMNEGWQGWTFAFGARKLKEQWCTNTRAHFCTMTWQQQETRDQLLDNSWTVYYWLCNSSALCIGLLAWSQRNRVAW